MLSMGKMVRKKGCTFNWSPEDGAVLHFPDGRKVQLQVKDDLPMMTCPAKLPTKEEEPEED